MTACVKVELPDALLDYITQQINAGDYIDAGDCIRHMIREYMAGDC